MMVTKSMPERKSPTIVDEEKEQNSQPQWEPLGEEETTKDYKRSQNFKQRLKAEHCQLYRDSTEENFKYTIGQMGKEKRMHNDPESALDPVAVFEEELVLTTDNGDVIVDRMLLNETNRASLENFLKTPVMVEWIGAEVTTTVQMVDVPENGKTVKKAGIRIADARFPKKGAVKSKNPKPPADDDDEDA